MDIMGIVAGKTQSSIHEHYVVLYCFNEPFG